MKRTLFVVLNVLAFQFVYSQSVVRSFVHGGVEREYRIYIPSVYTGNDAVPLLLNLHGYTSNAFEQEVYGDFRPIADTANFILVHPQGTTDAGGITFWNAFGSPTETVDDVSFISALIDTVAANYNIDEDRVYSTGMSNGGFMSYKLACELSSKIAAVASVTGSMATTLTSSCNAGRPVPAMQIHGTSDPTVPYLGNQSLFMEPIEDVVDYWVSNNGCDPTPTQTAVPDINQTDLCTADHFVYSGGIDGSSVEFFRVNGGAHTWPGTNPVFSSLGVTNQDFSASVEIWRFFSQYRLNELVSVDEMTENESRFRVFPNPSDGNILLQFETVDNRVIEIKNSLGQLVFSKQTADQQLPIELTNVGVYVLTVNDSGIQSVKKLIVE